MNILIESKALKGGEGEEEVTWHGFWTLCWLECLKIRMVQADLSTESFLTESISFPDYYQDH